uniref:Uncharacterized protein n=1 Tax=Cacopsylla melanoneura TaxID=428564 RepID=A0A8D8VAD3_9HEMI
MRHCCHNRGRCLEFWFFYFNHLWWTSFILPSLVALHWCISLKWFFRYFLRILLLWLLVWLLLILVVVSPVVITRKIATSTILYSAIVVSVVVFLLSRFWSCNNSCFKLGLQFFVQLPKILRGLGFCRLFFNLRRRIGIGISMWRIRRWVMIHRIGRHRRYGRHVVMLREDVLRR